MKRRNEKKHVIDFLFPLAVFFVLAASSVAIVVLASGFYSRQVKASLDSYYVTYLYAYDGYLRELFVRDGTEAKASDGRKILATKDFEAKETSDGIFHLYCENEDGKKTDTFVSVKSAAR